MKISVVIPAYNEERYIGHCLRALSRQSRLPDEVIVVDNNSTDNTQQIIRQFPNVRMIAEKKQGMAYARNAGYSAARGDIIARTDADCRPPTDWVQRIEGHFQARNTEVITGPTDFYDLPVVGRAMVLHCMEIVQQQLGYALTYGPNHALRTNVWRSIAHTTCTTDQRIHEDGDLGYHLHQAGYRVDIAPDLLNVASARRLIHSPLEMIVDYPRRVEYTLKSHDPSINFRFFALYRALLSR